MAYKTRTELLADFADNATGNIIAQFHRDFVDSVMVYGNLSAENVLSFGTSATPAKIPFNSTLFSYGMAADTSANEFDNVQQGHYLVILDIDASLAGNDVTYTIDLYADGSPVGNGFGYNTRDDSLRLSRAFVFPAAVPSDAGIIDLRISSTSAQTINIWTADWVLVRLGSA